MDSGKLVEFEHNRFREGAKFANGAGGLYSTASDMGRLIDSFRPGARNRVVSQPTLRLMTTLQTGSLLSDGNDARGYGLGWSVIRSVRGQNTLRSVGSFGHTGAFGTEFWHDPATEVSLVYLTQTFLVDETPRRQFSTMVNAALR
jgi:CubicO group peptidase (beta-lactamase class C family)